MAKQTAKEQVIVFEGEQKFIAPKVTITDKDTGKTEFVGSDGGQPPVPPSPMRMPQVGEPDFCNRLYAYIQSNGNGQASGDQVLAAHQAFQRYCNTPKKDETTTTTTKAPLPPSSEETTTTTKAPLPNPIVEIAAPLSFGLPLGGGGGEKEPEKKKNYWWILLVLGAAYLYFNKNKE